MDIKPLRPIERLDIDRRNKHKALIGMDQDKIGVAHCSDCGCKFEYFLERVCCPDCYDKRRRNNDDRKDY